MFALMIAEPVTPQKRKTPAFPFDGNEITKEVYSGVKPLLCVHIFEEREG
jgi:hypothetical protein